MTIPDQTYFPFINDEKQLENVVETIRQEMTDYIRQYHLQSLVLGISGGIDSALCAALLQPVCTDCNIPLIGRSITIETNKEDEIERSVMVGNNFCHDFAHLDLTDIFHENKKLLIHYDASQLSKMRQGNMKARMRMMVLYDLAQLYHGIVISTDNYTEFLTGFWTLHGDVGDFAPIMHLWKTEVYNLAKYLVSKEPEVARKEALESCIKATPVDGLGISCSDCEQLGVQNYFEADRLFAQFFAGSTQYDAHVLIKRYKASEYKRQNPVSIIRKNIINKK